MRAELKINGKEVTRDVYIKHNYNQYLKNFNECKEEYKHNITFRPVSYTIIDKYMDRILLKDGHSLSFPTITLVASNLGYDHIEPIKDNGSIILSGGEDDLCYYQYDNGYGEYNPVNIIIGLVQDMERSFIWGNLQCSGLGEYGFDYIKLEKSK